MFGHTLIIYHDDYDNAIVAQQLEFARSQQCDAAARFASRIPVDDYDQRFMHALLTAEITVAHALFARVFGAVKFDQVIVAHRNGSVIVMTTDA
jgi:hypothetical protein